MYIGVRIRISHFMVLAYQLNFMCKIFPHFSQRTEALLRYNLYVDCMPCEGLEQINKEWLDRMMRIARSTDRLKQPGMDSCASSLSKEVQLEFTRSMGKILFDKTVESQPGSFPFVTLPDPPEEVKRETGNYSLVYTRVLTRVQLISGRVLTEFQSTNGCGCSQPGLQSGLEGVHTGGESGLNPG